MTVGFVSDGNKFGRIGRYTVDGQVYGHPLIVPNLRVANRPNPITAVIIVTQRNFVSRSTAFGLVLVEYSDNHE